MLKVSTFWWFGAQNRNFEVLVPNCEKTRFRHISTKNNELTVVEGLLEGVLVRCIQRNKEKFKNFKNVWGSGTKYPNFELLDQNHKRK